MNRIILIGNGFDLAHGMETSYKSFIDDYWESTISEIRQGESYMPFENEEIKISNIPSGFFTGSTFQDLEEALNNTKSILEFKNTFLEKIMKEYNLNNWVDIENEYYFLLKRTFQDPKGLKGYDISNLNSDFKRIKDLLEKYLDKVNKRFESKIGPNILRVKRTIGDKIYSPFKMKDFSESSINQIVETKYEAIKDNIIAVQSGRISIENVTQYQRKIIERLDTKNHTYELKKMLLSESAIDYFDLIPDQTLFLNFNYTFTELLYENPREFCNPIEKKYTSPKFNHIHGTIDVQNKNPMIFGFGDEISRDYNTIEELNDNRYLENIKSINYLESDNYKRLLEFINSDNFQIFILGHSCGISDRTLLNTMFEHDNCTSIKVFYHKKKNGTDNYSDLVRNISRNFGNKAKMRDRVVNKKYCQPLS